ncbi:hypothetical protein [Mesorhizobium sp.]|uniref:hypothetical protein n=1 Tax=Mesorhizobium sp. TaxID=1871066 RepID=UPI0025BA05C9|nr:hypothetical protein [Mesorhizobium sp.]
MIADASLKGPFDLMGRSAGTGAVIDQLDAKHADPAILPLRDLGWTRRPFPRRRETL